jgi:hypothetical protein
MFQSEELKNHLETSSTVKSQTAVIAEWNMNFFENIADIGNYRHRPLLGITQKYGSLPSSYDPRDIGNFYTGATQADITIDGGLENENFIESMIYPNPTFDYITVEFSGTFADVELYDAQGKIIRRASIQSGDQLSLENEQSGVYFVRIISESGTFMHRVVKQQ